MINLLGILLVIVIILFVILSICLFDTNNKLAIYKALSIKMVHEYTVLIMKYKKLKNQSVSIN